MSYSVKGLTLALIITLHVLIDMREPLVLLGLLLITALWIYREKYCNSPWLMALEYILILNLSLQDPLVLVLCIVLAYDLFVIGLHWYVVLLLPGGFYFLEGEQVAVFFVLLLLSSFSGYLSHLLHQKVRAFQKIYDQERRSRYSLEETKMKLIRSTKEAVHLAEIKERNRIARDIHDDIGHTLAGILLQLQVVKKVQEKDQEKAHLLLEKSITRLSEAMDLLRDTVHNIKPRESMSIDYFKRIIEEFKYGKVEFTHSGDLSSLDANYTEILSSILKEGLTNISRHSTATLVKIELDVLEGLIRLHIKDNGQGCDRIHEGLGITGMKERVRSVGGNLTFNTKDGFSIVCVLPRLDKRGGRVLESPHC